MAALLGQGPGATAAGRGPGPAGRVASPLQDSGGTVALPSEQGKARMGGGAVAGRDAYGCWVPLCCWMWLLFSAKMFFFG